MRVVFLTHNYPRWAGDVSGAFLATLAGGLARRGVDVRVIAPSDEGRGIAVDGTGRAFVTGVTQATNFPTQSAVQSALAGGTDAFVTKLASDGTSLVFSTYLGGGGNDAGNAIALSLIGEAYLTGSTASSPSFVSTMTPSGVVRWVAWIRTRRPSG